MLGKEEVRASTFGRDDRVGQTGMVCEFSSESALGASALPSMPKSLQATGIDRLLIAELIAKSMLVFGKMGLSTMADKLKLSIHVLAEVLELMVIEHQAEIVRRGASDIDVVYQLSTAGKQRASEYMSNCRYVGPAPVSIDAYCRMVEKQSNRCDPVTQDDIAFAFAGVTINPSVRDQIGAAMNSGRPLFLYGPAGSGKTYIAEKLGRLMRGEIAVPYAISVENEIIQVFDPLLHRAVTAVLDDSASDLFTRRSTDNRWVLCERPLVLTGGELTLAMLDLRYDFNLGFYQAPPHLKANGGTFIVDDLGRHQIAPRELMNRWIVPLDRGSDYLTLHTGYKFTVPFDVKVVFSTNMRPHELADESFMRRLGYKIYVGPLTEEEYRSVFRQCSYSFGVSYDEDAFCYLVNELHRNGAIPLLACYPGDLLGQLVDYATFNGEACVMTPHALDRAWQTYFAEHDEMARHTDDRKMDPDASSTDASSRSLS